MNRFIGLVALVLSIISCDQPHQKQLVRLRSLNDSLKHIYAPDKRVAIYNISMTTGEEGIILTGETDQPQALEDLRSLLRSRDILMDDQVKVLPDSSVGNWTHAIVNNSVANIRSEPRHSGELATQAILGTPLKVLKIQGDFYLVQTPDGYISWVDHGGVTLLNTEKFDAWADAPKIIYTKNFGNVYAGADDELQKTGDIVLGSQLTLLETSDAYYRVQYPDLREGFVKRSESQPFEDWIKEIRASGSLIELYARDLMGVPYLWGGTSAKGMDCSGFTKTVYLMNGYIIPRDASQQIEAGIDVDKDLEMHDLAKGDLMFFGKKATDSTKQRVTHVGIWLGNGQGEFIHASGRVRIGSIDPDSPYYDEFNTNRYLGSRRYLGQRDELITDLKTTSRGTHIKS